MASNLPPGCSSSDGGIDQGFEEALETLCDNIPNEEVARKPAVRMVRLITAYLEGYRPKDWPKD